jgi:FkbM family methyltransferase
MKFIATTRQALAFLLVVTSSLCLYSILLSHSIVRFLQHNVDDEEQQHLQHELSIHRKSQIQQQTQSQCSCSLSSFQTWWDGLTAAGSISCHDVQTNLEQGLWIDPNKGQHFIRKIQQPSHNFQQQQQQQKPFYVSVHNKEYDRVRYSSIFEQGQYYEQKVYTRFERILQEGIEATIRNNNVTLSLPMVVDVGANIGYYSILSTVRQHAVVSFEINPTNLIRLCESIHWNQQHHHSRQNPQTMDYNQMTSSLPIRLFRNGVSNRHNETVQVVVPKRNPGEALVQPVLDQPNQYQHHQAATLYHSMTTTITLDDFAREHGWFTDGTPTNNHVDIAILKIDTEGHEPYILEGAQQLLRSGMVRNVLMEYRTSCRMPVINYLLNAGYVLVYDPSQYVTTSPTTMLTVEASRGYIENLHRSHALTDNNGNETKYKDLWFRWAASKLHITTTNNNNNNNKGSL